MIKKRTKEKRKDLKKREKNLRNEERTLFPLSFPPPPSVSKQEQLLRSMQGAFQEPCEELVGSLLIGFYNVFFTKLLEGFS